MAADPTFWSAYSCRADAYADAQQYQSAYDDYAKALSLGISEQQALEDVQENMFSCKQHLPNA